MKIDKTVSRKRDLENKTSSLQVSRMHNALSHKHIPISYVTGQKNQILSFFKENEECTEKWRMAR